jgi:hypothetical protein
VEAATRAVSALQGILGMETPPVQCFVKTS